MKEKEKMIREKIIGALSELLYEMDLIQIKSDEIATRAQVSKRTLYKYYETKTAMYLGVVERCFCDLNGYLERSVKAINDELNLKELEAMCRAYLKFMIEYPQQGKVIIFFNEQDYMQDYPEITRKIVMEANKYEPMKYFTRFNIKDNHSVFLPECLAIHVHSSIFGLSLLLQSKRYWLEGYFGKNVEEIIDENVKILMTILGGHWR